MTMHEWYGVICDANELICMVGSNLEPGTLDANNLSRAHNLLLALMIEGRPT